MLDEKKQMRQISGAEALEGLRFATAVEEREPPGEEPLSGWEQLDVTDFVNAVVLNEANEVMVFEHPQALGGVCWQMPGTILSAQEDPMTAVQQQLLQQTGYQTYQWTYLGSYRMEDGRQGRSACHFFCARDVVWEAQTEELSACQPPIKWISLAELKCALLDGRLSLMRYAMNVALALATVIRT